MKYFPVIFFSLLLLATACRIYEKPNYLQTFGTDHYWEGASSTHTYRYWIDSTYDFRLGSTLLVDETDSIPLTSFEKGSLYPSWIQNDKHPNTHMLFFRYDDPKSDTLVLTVQPANDTAKVLATDTFEEKERVVLVRKKK